MEGDVSSLEPAKNGSSSPCELLILHSAEAEEWAIYIQKILKSSKKIQKVSILLYAVGPDDHLHGYNFDHFQNAKCIVLLLTAGFLHMNSDLELQGSLRSLLYPPHRVVVLLCGVTEDDIPVGSFNQWSNWRKLYAEDEPDHYITTILESISESKRREIEDRTDAIASSGPGVPKVPKATEITNVAKTTEVVEVTEVKEVSEVTKVTEITEVTKVTEVVELTKVTDITEVTKFTEVTEVTEIPEEDVFVNSTVEENKEEEPLNSGNDILLNNATILISTDLQQHQMKSSKEVACLTVQPNRILCGDRETIFIMFTCKIDDHVKLEVEFSSGTTVKERVQGTLQNEYTISVTSPDMPRGVVSLTMHTEQLSVNLKPITYYTHMEEVSRFLENATTPMDFLCQAFDITAKKSESLDNILTDSIKSRIPKNGFQLFGIRQLEENNTGVSQRDEEFPTLLHLAAKYGLRKLTAILLQCPGVLQAYSVMNKHGDYPNTLAEKSGFSDLRDFIDNFVAKEADMLETQIKDSISADDDIGVYESMMAQPSENIIKKYSGCLDDTYESMLDLEPENADELYEEMDFDNPEEALLRKFFEENRAEDIEEYESTERATMEEHSIETLKVEQRIENIYGLDPEDVYEHLDGASAFVFNRPPAPFPRPVTPQPGETMKYISKVFQERVEVKPHNKASSLGQPGAPDTPKRNFPVSPVYHPFGGMQTPGQRQLIALQERVKVGEITVDEAVQEFKTWQTDHQRRSSSVRYQQENLKKLRDSITRRHKQREKTGKELDLEITAPIQRGPGWGFEALMECSVYDSASNIMATPPPVNRPILRDTWKTGSTSSSSSNESNRLSTHSTISCSSGTEPDFEDISDLSLPPSRSPRGSIAAPLLPPPRLPPRIPGRFHENVPQDRYISCPTRALLQRPTSSQSTPSPPPIPRRTR